MEPLEAESLVRRELESSESLLWAGVPKQGLTLRSSDLLAIPSSLLFCAFVLFWEFQVVQSGAPLFMRLWGGLFLVFGAYSLVGRFFVDAYQRSKTAYGLSDRRIMIVSGLGSKSVKSLALDSLPEINLTERTDRSGTITFGPVPFGAGFSPFAMRGAWGYRGGRAPVSPSFEMIPQVKDVLERIRQAQKSFKR